jgi:ketopantoate reductase
VEIFAGKAVALGDEYRVPTPLNLAMMHMIKVLEATR